jgi:hypothetical protein
MPITSVKNRPVLTPPDEFTWPGDFTRIPDEEWTRQPVDQFGLKYDEVGNHGWYMNLDPLSPRCWRSLPRWAWPVPGRQDHLGASGTA